MECQPYAMPELRNHVRQADLSVAILFRSALAIYHAPV